ncbi:MAG TPA: XRE family transcriptional regulator [Stellaceae bacterium]|nr:XRE family transcriptional regulator [Stellaceae bacterium]
MFNPSRLTLARKRRKFTKTSFADALDCDVKTVIRWESGEIEPSPENLAAISDTLQYPTAFFYGKEIDEPQSEAVSFRALSAMPARDRDAALAAAALAFLLSDWIENLFELPPHDLPDFKENPDPEAAALILRQKWGIGERPISNMVKLLESKGVRVFSLAENTRTVDAFSLWRREKPYVFLNTMKTAERSRFDAAHELGHIVLHKHGGPQGRFAEEQANHFASAFLIPEAQIKAILPRVSTLNQLVEAKKRWGVSVAALAHRLHKLKVVSDWQYRRFCIQIEERFHSSEPYSRLREYSTVLEKVLGSLRTERITKHQIAEALSLPVEEVEHLLFRLTNMQSIDGQGLGTAKGRAKLVSVQ